jgi:hypothetical protein
MDKQIYFYWGNQRMSFLRYMTIKSFSFYNPEWKIILVKNDATTSGQCMTIEEDDLKTYFGHDYRFELHKIPNLIIINVENIFPFDYRNLLDVHIKDMLNWHLLATRGCTVADMDILFCNPIEKSSYINWDADVNICNYDFYRNYMPVSFMISKSHSSGINSFYNDVYENSRRRYRPNEYQCCGTSSIPYKSIYDIINAYSDLIINKMDSAVAFPFAKDHIFEMVHYAFNVDGTNIFDSNTVGIHWYGGDKISKKYNSLITPQNYMTFNNTISIILKKIFN